LPKIVNFQVGKEIQTRLGQMPEDWSYREIVQALVHDFDRLDGGLDSLGEDIDVIAQLVAT
jgi:hypothetical protein